MGAASLVTLGKERQDLEMDKPWLGCFPLPTHRLRRSPLAKVPLLPSAQDTRRSVCYPRILSLLGFWLAFSVCLQPGKTKDVYKKRKSALARAGQNQPAKLLPLPSATAPPLSRTRLQQDPPTAARLVFIAGGRCCQNHFVLGFK